MIDKPKVTDQPKRPYKDAKDYLSLPRFHFGYGRETNATNYWKDKLDDPDPPVLKRKRP
jgi:hypothetical protein